MAADEIRFKPHPSWAKDEELLAKRIAAALNGDCQICPPFKQEMGVGDSRWVLDGSNDWWFRFYPETNECVIRYRYGGEHCAAALKGLKTFLEWRLG